MELLNNENFMKLMEKSENYCIGNQMEDCPHCPLFQGPLRDGLEYSDCTNLQKLYRLMKENTYGGKK